MVPSRRPPIVTSWICARPCTMAVMFSVRVSVQRTGRPQRRASQPSTRSSGCPPILAPNPPPTSGATTRTLASSSPYVDANANRSPWAFCVEHHSTRRPSTHAAAADRPSSGAAARRWFTIRWRTTTSHPAGPPGDVGPDLVAERGHQVRAELGEQHRLAAQAVDRIDDRGQRVVVDDDPLGGVGALLGGLAEHDGHRLADEAHPVGGHERAGHGPIAHAGHRRKVDLGSRDDVDDARQAARLVDVDPGDQGVRHGRADERGVHRTLERRVAQVGHVAPALGQQPWVLDAGDPRPEDAHGGVSRA